MTYRTVAASRAARTAAYAALALLAAPLQPIAAQDTVATVNGTAVSKSVYEAYLETAARQTQGAPLTDQQKAQVLDQLINLELAAASARKAGLDKKPDVAGQLELMRLNVLADADFSRFLEANPATDAQIKAEYDAQVGNLPQEYRARHILVDEEAKAKSVIDKLNSGESFADLAKTESKDQSAASGGDLGWFTLQSMVKPFSDAVSSLEKGTYTKAPVQSQFGWHVIQLEDTRKAEAPPMDQVKEQIEAIVQRKKLQTYVEGLREGAKIQKTN
ncbi:MAG TPA: peptidylprolyl isomerase [Steroidobacteraceae bacterium]|nr:peptidylprolyl isomerase [Steroidobacteraceae bacterium]